MQVDAETGTQRRCERTAAGSGSYKGKGIEVDLNAAGRRTLVDHDVDAIVLHG